MGRNHRRKRKYKFNQRERAAMARANVALRAYQPWRLLDVRDVTPVGWVVGKAPVLCRKPATRR